MDREKELDAKLEEIRKLFPQKCAHCYEMLSLLRAHFASHLEDEGATKRPETFAPSEDRSLVTPFDPPPPKENRPFGTMSGVTFSIDCLLFFVGADKAPKICPGPLRNIF